MSEELTGDQKLKIEEEEKYRQEFRQRLNYKPDISKKQGCFWSLIAFGLLIFFITFFNGGKEDTPQREEAGGSATISSEEEIKRKEEEKPRQPVETKNTVKEYLDKEYTLTKREMDVLDTIPSASVFMTKLGSKELYDEIIGVSKQLMIILAEKESTNIPPGYEKSHEYSIKATKTYVEYARTLADGIYYKDTQKIKDATSKLREATGYLDLSGELMPKKQ